MYNQEIKSSVERLGEQFLKTNYAPATTEAQKVAEDCETMAVVVSLVTNVLINLNDIATALRGMQETLENRRDWTR